MKDFSPFDAWLAGFLDGEGTIVTTTANGRPFVYVVITQHERSRAVLEEIQSVYGGFISRHNSLGSYTPICESSARRPSKPWRLSSKRTPP
jgi:hypothetical protein